MKPGIFLTAGFCLLLSAFGGEKENLFLAHTNDNGTPEGRKVPPNCTVRTKTAPFRLRSAHPVLWNTRYISRPIWGTVCICPGP